MRLNGAWSRRPTPAGTGEPPGPSHRGRLGVHSRGQDPAGTPFAASSDRPPSHGCLLCVSHAGVPQWRKPTLGRHPSTPLPVVLTELGLRWGSCVFNASHPFFYPERTDSEPQAGNESGENLIMLFCFH